MADNTNLADLRFALGIGDNVPDSDLQTLLQSAQGKKELSKIESQPSGGSFLDSGLQALLDHWNRSEKPVMSVFDALANRKPEAPKGKGKDKGGGKGADLGSVTSAAKEVTQQSPYEELANALANSYLQQVNQLEPLISGQGIFGAGGQTDQAVKAAEQMAPGSAGFLQQAANAEGKASQPLQQAMGQVGEAEAQGALGTAGAIANSGLANTEYLSAAPYQQILQELAQETAYKAASGQGAAAAFGATSANTPAWLQNIFKTLGLQGATGLNTPKPPPGNKTPKQAATGGTSGTTSATSGQGNPSSPNG